MPSEQAAFGDTTSLKLDAFQLPSDYDYVSSRLSEKPGAFYILSRPWEGSGKDYKVVEFTVGNQAVEEKTSLSTPKLRTESGGFPRLFLSDGKILLQKSINAGASENVDFRGLIRYSLLVPPANIEQDITPENMEESTKWLCRSGPPFFWSDERGLVFFVPNQKERTVHIWQGKKKLSKTDMVSDVLGIGQGFYGGRFTFVIIKVDGSTSVFNPKTGKLDRDNSFSPLAKRFAASLGEKPKWPFVFLFAKHMVAYRDLSDGTDKFTILSTDGRKQSFIKRSAIDYKPDGSRRSDFEADALVENSRPLIEEGARQPVGAITIGSDVIAVDERRLGIIDFNYAKLIIITAEKQ